jgi:L-alanine-DL-glutamate epimerase-like enolase superfamily enzyme
MQTFTGLSGVAVGHSAADRAALWQRMYEATYLYGKRGSAVQAMGAIDMACTDVVGKYLGVGASYLFGGLFRDQVPVYASAVLPANVDELRDLAQHVSAAGFPALKVGWGPFASDTTRVLSMVETLRSALASSVRLIFDIGFERRRSLKELLHLIGQLEAYDPLWVEEPCHPDDLDTIRRLIAGTNVEIAAGETYTTLAEFDDLLATGIGIVQPDLASCGGFTVATAVASRTARFNCRVIPHAWLNDVLLAATLQYCAMLPGETFLEYSLATGPLMEICEPKLRIDAGFVRVPAGPGLGVTLDEERLEEICDRDLRANR